jgi:hypothetical protein
MEILISKNHEKNLNKLSRAEDGLEVNRLIKMNPNCILMKIVMMTLQNPEPLKIVKTKSKI